MIHWHDLHHSELDVPTLYAILQLRCAVFVVEQTCAYQDIDGDYLVGIIAIFSAGMTAGWWLMRGF